MGARRPGGRGAETEAKPGTQGHHWEPIGHATGTATEKRLMKINKRTAETASDLQLRLGGARGTRTPGPLLANQPRPKPGRVCTSPGLPFSWAIDPADSSRLPGT